MAVRVRWWLVCAGATVAVSGSMMGQVSPVSAVRLDPDGRPAIETTQAQQAYIPPGENLHLGDSGAAVSSVQARLAQLGYYP